MEGGERYLFNERRLKEPKETIGDLLKFAASQAKDIHEKNASLGLEKDDGVQPIPKDDDPQIMIDGLLKLMATQARNIHDKGLILSPPKETKTKKKGKKDAAEGANPDDPGIH